MSTLDYWTVALAKTVALVVMARLITGYLFRNMLDRNVGRVIVWTSLSALFLVALGLLQLVEIFVERAVTS